VISPECYRPAREFVVGLQRNRFTSTKRTSRQQSTRAKAQNTQPSWSRSALSTTRCCSGTWSTLGDARQAPGGARRAEEGTGDRR